MVCIYTHSIYTTNIFDWFPIYQYIIYYIFIGKEGRAKHFCHSISTAALIAGTKTMGKEYAGTGVTVNCVAPLVDYQVKQLGTKAAKKETKNIPMGRAAEESELAGLVAFIASEENTYTTGFCYDLSGGYTI